MEIFKADLISVLPNMKIFDKYYVGYSIPQIGKEFDLLRIGTHTIINIELKSDSTLESIKKQLQKNKYYLSFLKREVVCFSYKSKTKELFELSEQGELSVVNLRQLIARLAPQNIDDNLQIDSLFKPNNYLVSPFNSTKEFIKGEYFLTNHQEKIKHNVLKCFDTPDHSIVAIKGKAGTGKTLLTYDIAKHIYKSYEILIIHCGILNQGHSILRDDYAWNIVPVRDIGSQDFSKFYLIIIDEAQRIYPNQLKHVINQIKLLNKNCIFSYDSVQTLRGTEERNDNSSEIERNLNHTPFELTTKIRTNKEVARFIKCLFNNTEVIHKLDYSNVEVNYFENPLNAKSYLQLLNSHDWKIINYTPSSRHDLPYDDFRIIHETDNAHTVIGQEFNKVVGVIDEHFYYKSNGKLSTKGYIVKPYYHPTKMLFQILSRTKIKLNIVIIKNQEILQRCLNIMNKSSASS
jgi:hypothetical protein